MGRGSPRTGGLASFADLAAGLEWTGNVPDDAHRLLCRHGLRHIAVHGARVARRAVHLALELGDDTGRAETAAWLHDISAVYPNHTRVQVARSAGIEILDQEAQAPMILHQKLSAAMAEALFGVADQQVLSAIRCHTTLRAGASRLDKIVFVADKIAWDQEGTPPYLDGLLVALTSSLDRAALYYLNYLWQRRDTLLVVHPWLADAYHDLRLQLAAQGS